MARLTKFGMTYAEAARALGISRSCLYYIPKKPIRDETLKARIADVLEQHPAYGHRRIAIDLSMNKKAVLRIMRKYNLWPTAWPNNRKKCSKKKTPPSWVPNLMETTNVLQADEVWSGDFTYLKYGRCYLFLATVMDTYTREIVGWQLGSYHTQKLVIEALEQAFKNRGRTALIFHSDQGSEYTSHACMDWLLNHGITPSHSPRGKPWKNGKQESFYNTLKREMRDFNRFPRFDHLFEAISQFIHYYNTRRIHSALRMPPHAFCLKTATRYHPHASISVPTIK